MPLLSGIYDSGPIAPVAKFKENLSIWTGGRYEHYIIEFIEGIPRSTPTMVEMVTASGATTLAAGGTIARQVVAIIQLNRTEFLHLRFEPRDNVEALLWEQAGTARLNTRRIHARVDRDSRRFDPHLSMTTFFILGMDRDANIEVRNPMSYITPVARIDFWGFRYVLSAFPTAGLSEGVIAKLGQGDRDTVKNVIGMTTWLPAEGRGA